MLIGLTGPCRARSAASGSRSRLALGMPGYFLVGFAGGMPSALAVSRILSGPSGIESVMSTKAVLTDCSSAYVASTAEP